MTNGRKPRAIRGPIIGATQIVSARIMSGISQSELAEQLGMSVTALSNLEVGKSRAAGGRAVQIAELFLDHGVMFLGPQAAGIYAALGMQDASSGEGVQRVSPDTALTANLLAPD